MPTMRARTASRTASHGARRPPCRPPMARSASTSRCSTAHCMSTTLGRRRRRCRRRYVCAHGRDRCFRSPRRCIQIPARMTTEQRRRRRPSRRRLLHRRHRARAAASSAAAAQLPRAWPSQRPDDRTLSFRNKQLNERMTRARRQRAAAMAFTKAGATVRQAPAGVEISMRAAATVRQEGATTAALAALPEAAPATTPAVPTPPAKPKRGGSSVTQSTPEMLKARRRSEALGITVPTCGTTFDLDGGPPPVILPPSGGSFLVLVADDEKKQTTRERTPQRPAFTAPSEPDVDSPPQRLSSAERKSLARHSLAVARPPSDLFASPAPTYSEPMKLRSASRKEKAGGESREASRTREERMEALRSRTASRKQRATATATASSSSTSSPLAVAAGSSSDIRSGGEPSPSVVTEAAAPSSVAAARAMFERKAAAPSEAAPAPSRKSVAKEPIMRV